MSPKKINNTLENATSFAKKFFTENPQKKIDKRTNYT